MCEDTLEAVALEACQNECYAADTSGAATATTGETGQMTGD